MKFSEVRKKRLLGLMNKLFPVDGTETLYFSLIKFGCLLTLIHENPKTF